MKTTTYWESSDVARALGVSVSAVRLMAITGTLVPVARTRRGGRLFRETDVRRVLGERLGKGTGA